MRKERDRKSSLKGPEEKEVESDRNKKPGRVGINTEYVRYGALILCTEYIFY